MVVIEEDYLSILGMVSGCATPDLVMLKWITVIKSLNSEIRHISRKENAMANILSRARFEGEYDMVSEEEEVRVDIFESAQLSANWQSPQPCTCSTKTTTKGSGF
mgnify:CR=1 FL=1